MVPFGNFGWNFGFGFGWLVIIVTVILIIFSVIRLAKSTPGRSGKDLPFETPLDILKRRYARGEITKEEFEEKKKDVL